MLEDVISGPRVTCTYDSLAELADAADRRVSDERSNRGVGNLDWYGGATHADAVRLAQTGWQDQLPDALAIAESAIAMASREHIMDTFQPVWDVTGAEVDVARYLSGEPECMINFPLSRTSREGRVITLVASGSCSAAIEPETVVRRGQLIVALVLALSRLGHATELWVDNRNGITVPEAVISVKVKGINDELDPAAIMFAYAHPACQRRLFFGVVDGYPGTWGSARKATGLIGTPMPPDPGMYPEGAIILPELKSERDVPDADQFLRKYLGELGLLAE